MEQTWNIEEVCAETGWDLEEATLRINECGPLLERDQCIGENGETRYTADALKILRFERGDRITLLHGRIATLRRIVTIKQDLVDRTLTDTIRREQELQNQILALRLELLEKNRELDKALRQREMNHSDGTKTIPQGTALKSALQIAAGTGH